MLNISVTDPKTSCLKIQALLFGKHELERNKETAKVSMKDTWLTTAKQ